MPHLERLAKEYKDRGLVVLTISDQERADILEFLEKHPLATLNGYVSGEAKASWFLRGADARPLTFILDREGVIREFLVGRASYDSFAKLILKYL